MVAVQLPFVGDSRLCEHESSCVDSLCYPLVHVRLQPRDTVGRPSRRRLLADAITMHWVAEGDALFNAKCYLESSQVFRAAANRSADPQIFEDLAWAMRRDQQLSQGWEITMYLLEGRRLRKPERWVTRKLGQDLALTGGDIVWSIQVLEQSVSEKLKDAKSHFFFWQAPPCMPISQQLQMPSTCWRSRTRKHDWNPSSHFTALPSETSCK